MEKEKVVTVTESRVVDVLCNKCGISCKDSIDAAGEHYNFNYAHITSHFDYGSIYYDGDRFDVHICEDCYKEFESSFKIKPEATKNYWGY